MTHREKSDSAVYRSDLMRDKWDRFAHKEWIITTITTVDWKSSHDGFWGEGLWGSTDFLSRNPISGGNLGKFQHSILTWMHHYWYFNYLQCISTVYGPLTSAEISTALSSCSLAALTFHSSTDTSDVFTDYYSNISLTAFSAYTHNSTFRDLSIKL